MNRTCALLLRLILVFPNRRVADPTTLELPSLVRIFTLENLLQFASDSHVNLAAVHDPGDPGRI